MKSLLGVVLACTLIACGDGHKPPKLNCVLEANGRRIEAQGYATYTEQAWGSEIVCAHIWGDRRRVATLCSKDTITAYCEPEAQP